MLTASKASIYLLSLALLLSGCKTFNDEIMQERPAKELYQMGWAEIKNENYGRAAKIFEEVYRQHPNSELAQEAYFLSASARAEDRQYAQAIAQVETFIQLHPDHKDVAFLHHVIKIFKTEARLYAQRQALRASGQAVQDPPSLIFSKNARATN